MGGARAAGLSPRATVVTSRWNLGAWPARSNPAAASQTPPEKIRRQHVSPFALKLHTHNLHSRTTCVVHVGSSNDHDTARVIKKPWIPDSSPPSRMPRLVDGGRHCTLLDKMPFPFSRSRQASPAMDCPILCTTPVCCLDRRPWHAVAHHIAIQLWPSKELGSPSGAGLPSLCSRHLFL